MTELTMVRGDTLPLYANVVMKGTSVPVPLAGKTLKFTLKRAYTDTDLNAVLQLASPARISVTDAVTALIEWQIRPADLPATPIAHRVRYVWDLQYSDAADPAAVYTLDSGYLYVDPDVTLTNS